MDDRLQALLDQNRFLYGVICRNPSMIDIELMAQEGYHIIWFDLEHASVSLSHAADLARFAWHLGMIPLVRTVELTRSNLQIMLDSGFRIILLPDVKNANQASQLVQLGKYPPLGQRGFSTTAASNDFQLGPDLEKTLRLANATTHLMVQFESDEGYGNLDTILAVEGIDMVVIGPGDWAISAGLFGEAKKQLDKKIGQVLTSAHDAGKTTAMGIGNPNQVKHFADIGVRIFFAGPDITLHRSGYARAINSLRDAV